MVGAEPGPEQTPDTFHGVDVNLVDAVSIKLLPTCQTAISLSGMLTLVPTLSGDLVRVAVRTPHTLRSAVSSDHLKTLVVV